jgi:hypothetical protein
MREPSPALAKGRWDAGWRSLSRSGVRSKSCVRCERDLRPLVNGALQEPRPLRATSASVPTTRRAGHPLRAGRKNMRWKCRLQKTGRRGSLRPKEAGPRETAQGARADAAAPKGIPSAGFEPHATSAPCWARLPTTTTRGSRADRMPTRAEAFPPRGAAAHSGEALLRTPPPKSGARMGVALAACASVDLAGAPPKPNA